MRTTIRRLSENAGFGIVAVLIVLSIPGMALAQSTDPFETGATNLVTNLITLATPVAALLIIALGVAAAAGRLSWGWPIGMIAGIGLIFAAQPMVTFVKGLFGQ